MGLRAVDDVRGGEELRRGNCDGLKFILKLKGEEKGAAVDFWVENQSVKLNFHGKFFPRVSTYQLTLL